MQLGEDFSLPYTVLGELEMAVDFSWEYPGQKVSRGEEEAVCMLWWCLGQSEGLAQGPGTLQRGATAWLGI